MISISTFNHSSSRQNIRQHSYRMAVRLFTMALLGLLFLLAPSRTFSPSAFSQSLQTLYISDNGSDTSNCQNSTSPCQTLQYALNQATSSNVTVYILSQSVHANQSAHTGASVPSSITNLTLTTNLTGEVRIGETEGAQTPSPGQAPPSNGSVLTIPQSNQTVTISHLTIERGYALDGGGIYNKAGTVYLNNVSVMANMATYGGGIYNSGTMILSSSLVDFNEAGNITALCTGSYCFQEASGGGILNEGTMTIDRSLIANNIVGSLENNFTIPYLYFGMGVDDQGSLTILASSVVANRPYLPAGEYPSGSTIQGAGIFSNSSQLTIVSSTIAGNTLPIAGGAGIYLGGGFLAPSSMSVGDSYIANNFASDTNTLDNCMGTPQNGTINSLGYNVSDSSQCNLTQPTDQSSVYVNMEPSSFPSTTTPYFYPSPNSAGVSLVPYNAPLEAGYGVCPSVDMFGHARPAEGYANCTVGAVEVSSSTPASPPYFTSSNSAIFTDGEKSSFAFKAGGAPSSVFSSEGSLPPDISLSPEGLLSGQASSTLTYPLTVTANNQDGTATQDFTLAFQKASPEIAISAKPTEVGQPETVSVQVQDANAANEYYPTGIVSISGAGSSSTLCALSLSPMSQGSDISQGSCTISALPHGITSLTATYQGDSVYTSTLASVPLSVANALAVQSSPNSTAIVGSTYSYTPSITGGSAPYSYSYSGSLPPGMSFDTSDGSLSGVPSQTGSYNFLLSVKDSLGASVTKSTNLKIVPSPTSLKVTFPSSPALAGSILTFRTLVSGYDPSGQVNIVSNGTLLCSATLLQGSGTCAAALGSGTYSLYATYPGDSNNSPSATLTENLSIVPPLGVIGTSLPPATSGESYEAQLEAFGGQSPYTWTLISGQLPSGLMMTPAGVISGTPAEGGTYNFTVSVTDSTPSLEQTQRQSYTIFVGSKLSISIPNNNLSQGSPPATPTPTNTSNSPQKPIVSTPNPSSSNPGSSTSSSPQKTTPTHHKGSSNHPRHHKSPKHHSAARAAASSFPLLFFLVLFFVFCLILILFGITWMLRHRSTTP